ACDVDLTRDAARNLVPREEPKPADERDERHRCREEEDPAPADLGQGAAEHEPERETGCSRAAEDRERLVARRALSERGRDDRKRGGCREGRAHALDEAGRDQEGAVVRESAEHRSDDEYG